jgi:hypothetical protein
VVTALLSSLLAACGRGAGWYPIPPQQSLDLGPDPEGVALIVRMDDADAGDYIVRDVDRNPGPWRWALLHPELRFRAPHAQGLHFIAEIAIPEVTFHVTGPVIVRYFLDGRPLGSLRCDHTGKYEIDQPLPSAWAPSAPYVHIMFETDRHWVSPDDGTELSFLLFHAGFRL